MNKSNKTEHTLKTAAANYSEKPVTIYKFSYVCYVTTRVLKKIFAVKSDEVTGQWRRLHAKLYDLYRSSSTIKVKVEGTP